MLDSRWLFFVYYIGWETRCGRPPGAGHYLNIQKNAYTSQGVMLQHKLIAEKPCAALPFGVIFRYDERE